MKNTITDGCSTALHCTLKAISGWVDGWDPGVPCNVKNETNLILGCKIVRFKGGQKIIVFFLVPPPHPQHERWTRFYFAPAPFIMSSNQDIKIYHIDMTNGDRRRIYWVEFLSTSVKTQGQIIKKVSGRNKIPERWDPGSSLLWTESMNQINNLEAPWTGPMNRVRRLEDHFLC